jgi:hypothetical protein
MAKAYIAFGKASQKIAMIRMCDLVYFGNKIRILEYPRSNI